MICGAAFAALATAAPAFAQDAEVEAVTITGTRIARQDFVANSPVSTVTAEDIKASGDLNTEEILNALPQVVPGLTAASNNPSDGTATVDLRGIGPQRTLVLVNGRRLNPSTRSNTVDLNNIPTRLIEKVEVVTGGASAVYGSDALSGVVNFVLKDDFEGIELTSQYGLSGYSDGEQSDTSILFGANVADGRGNVTGYVSYYDRDRILPNSDRPSLIVSNAGGSGTGLNGGLDNLALNCFGAVDPSGVGPVAACGTYLPTSRRSFDLNGDVRPFVNDFSLATGDRYNFTSVNNLLSPAERFNIALMGNYDINANVTAFTEVFYTDSRNAAQLAPTPATGIQIPANNAFITDPSPGTITSNSLRDLLNSRPNPNGPLNFSRRMAEVGARIETRDSDLWQINTGLRADLGNGWKADGYVSYGRTEFRVGVQNDVSRSRLSAALTSTNGTTCSAAALAIYPTCVPINLFGGNSITTEAADFVRLNFSDLTVFERYIAQANVTGTLFTLPAGDVQVAFGTEYREESLSFTPDAAKAAGDIYGFNAERPVGGSQSVGEIYGEAIVPLVADVVGVNYLGLELGARWSDYSSVGNVMSYKFGAEYAPIEGLRFRAMYQQSNRAPSVFELFQQGDQGFPAVLDPCTTVNPGTGAARTLTAQVRAFCTTQLGFDPVTNNFVALNTQTEAFFYGNPGLSEEKSETVTAGIVWTPTFVPSLSVSLDYYDIKVEDYIGTRSGGTSGIVAACFAAADLTSPACFDAGIGLPLIYRDVAGNLKARAPLGNVSALQTKGVDFAVSYGWNVPWGGGDLLGDKLQIDLVLTHLDSYELDGIEYAGTIGSYNITAALPEWKANVRLGYDIGPVRVAYNGTYIGEMDNQGNIPDFQDGGYIGTDAIWYHDVSARWSVNDNVELFGGIKNLTDEDPQVFDNAPDGNTDPNSFDILGRYFFGGVTLRF
jgi:iron complex outermembrane recepter protein